MGPGRGFPEDVQQKVEPDINKAKKLHGTTKAAVLIDDVKCPGLIACSVYDTKPVHILSTCATSVDWKILKRTVYDSTAKKSRPMKFLRLNLIDMYNHKMNSVDLADQMRNCYRFNHWLCNRKWWWSIFLWAIGVGATNAYIMYESLYEEEKKKNLAMPAKWDHMEFLQQLIHDFIGWDPIEVVNDDDDTTTAAYTRQGSSYSSVQSQPQHFFDLRTEEGREEYVALVKPSTITAKRMGVGAFFTCRFDGMFHPSIPVKQWNAYCQYCKYKYNAMCEFEQQHNVSMRQNKGVNVERCITCNVNLCWQCRITWHNVSLERLNATVSR